MLVGDRPGRLRLPLVHAGDVVREAVHLRVGLLKLGGDLGEVPSRGPLLLHGREPPLDAVPAGRVAGPRLLPLGLRAVEESRRLAEAACERQDAERLMVVGGQRDAVLALVVEEEAEEPADAFPAEGVLLLVLPDHAVGL